MATPAAAPMSEATRLAIRANLQKSLMNSGGWFYWVAALSVINSILALAGANIRFIFGMGLTEIIDAVGHEVGGKAGAVSFVATCLIAGVCVVFGVLVVKKHQTWALWLGMALYLVDALLLLPFGEILGAIFHAWVLFRLFGAAGTLKQLHELEQAQPGIMDVPPKPIA